jgi:hypothetical protein
MAPRPSSIGTLWVPLVIALFWSAWPAAARAETVVLLVGHEPALALEREQAEAALAQALESEGTHIVSQTQAEDRVGGAAASCTGSGCVAELVRGAGADAALELMVRALPNATSAMTVEVLLVDRTGRRFPGSSPVADRDFARAARDALFDARSLQLLGQGPWLRVRSAPSGAQVLLDGHPMGSTPTRAAVRAGRHTLEVRVEGLRPHVQTVDIPADPSRQIEIGADLAPRGQSSGVLADRDARATRANERGTDRPVLGPMLLGAAGAALVAYEVIPIAGDSCEHIDDSGACAERSTINRSTAVALGALGVAAMAGGLLWHIFGGDDEASGTALAIGISPVGVRARARF